MQIAKAHGWAWSVPVNQTFTDGLETLTLSGDMPGIISKVELVGDDALELVGAKIAPPPRRIAFSQVFEKWPPGGKLVFDPATLVDIPGAEVGSEDDSPMGWELLLGIRATQPGVHLRTGIRIYYTVGEKDFVAEIPAELQVCAGAGLDPADCPLP
jgi:hypothetical protein